MKKLVNWVIAFLNRNSDLTGYLCDLGIAHRYIVEDNKEFCKYCKKPFDKWDFFWLFHNN